MHLPPRRKFGLGLLATVVLLNAIVLSLGLHSLEESRIQDIQRAEVQTQNLAQALNQSLTSRLERIDQSLQTIARELEASPQTGASGNSAIDRVVAVQQDLLHESDALRITDARGDVLIGRGIDRQNPINVIDRDYFIHHRDTPASGLFMSKPLLGRIRNEWIVTFSRRVNLPDGGFGGVVLASISVESLHAMLDRFDVGPSGTITLRSSELEFIARQPTVLRGQTLAIGDRNVSRELQELVRSGETRTTYHTTTPFDQVRRVFTFHRLEKAPLIILVGMAEEDYLAQWSKDRVVTAGVLVLFLLVTLLSALFLWRSWLRQQAAFESLTTAEARTRLFSSVFQQGGEAFVVTDRENRIVEVNDAFTRLTGYSPAEVIGRNPRILSSGHTTPDEYRDMWRAIERKGFWQGEMWDRYKDGHTYPKWMTISVVRDNEGRIGNYIATFANISELKAAEDKIRFLAHHDALTGLPNRLNLQARLDQILAVARREGQQVAVVFIDLDNFKHINDSLGHKVGDGLLVEVANRLRNCVRASDVVARLGGDEFVVVLENAGALAVPQVVDKIIKSLAAPCRIDEFNLHTMASFGISLFPDDGEAVEVLMKNADTAMYHAKAIGKNGYQFFATAMNVAATERLALESDLRQALAEGHLCLHFQPQIDVPSGRVVGMEALARWPHPERGMIPPDKFIPIAEQSGLIIALGAWVLDEALRQLTEFEKSGLSGLRVAVNLSAHQLRDPGLPDAIDEALGRHGLAPSRLELEITESVAMDNPEKTAQLFGQLRKKGIGLAIDDFGTGYSSLAYLKQLPFHRLKIDRSFVKDIEDDKNDAVICAATLSLAHSLGLEVVAEGVETPAQHAFLAGLGCDLVQGYYYSRPLPPAACADYIRAAMEPAILD